MNIGIDASNIKAGGGLTHLKELIENYQLDENIQLVLFADDVVLSKIEDRADLKKVSHSFLNKNFIWATLWRLFICNRTARKYKIDVMFSPGGNFLLFKPYVSMSQNMLVFETKERNRFPHLSSRLRYIFLEFKQVLSFLNANGIIYISNYAKTYIQKKYPVFRNKKSVVVYHGVSDRFDFKGEKEILNPEFYGPNKPFKLLYVSIINYYKHQDKIIEGVARLKAEGIPIELHLVGPINPKIEKQFNTILFPHKSFVHYHGMIPYTEIEPLYHVCDLFVFASTCENMPNILVEAMRAKAPILCSSYGPMPEIFKDAGLYFDPTDVEDFCEKVKTYFNSRALRLKASQRAAELSKTYLWKESSLSTFDFLKSFPKKK